MSTAKRKSPPAADRAPDDTALPGLPRWDADIREVVLAVGLGLVIFFRPWRDGMTFPNENFYFLWVIAVVTVLLASRLLFRRQPVRCLGPAGLFLGFLAVAFLTSFSSVQRDATVRGLVIWTGHFLLFFVAVNGLRSRSAVLVVLAFFVVSSVAETAWSLLHVRYVMPMTRQQIMNDPSTVLRYFGATEITEAIKSRLESNRATGTLLFANALACWILTGIPLAIGGAMNGYLRLRSALAATRPAVPDAKDSGDRLTNAAIAGITTSVLLFLAIFMYYSFYFFFVYVNDIWWRHPVRWALYCLVVPIAAGSVAVSVSRKHGVGTWLLCVQTGGLAALVLLQLVGLAYTFSRGGMMAVAGAVAVMAWLMWPAVFRKRKAGAALARAAAVWGVIMASWLAYAGHAAAQPPSAAAANPAVQQPRSAPTLAVPLVPAAPGVKQPELVVKGTDYTRGQFLSHGLAAFFLLGIGA